MRCWKCLCLLMFCILNAGTMLSLQCVGGVELASGAKGVGLHLAGCFCGWQVSGGNLSPGEGWRLIMDGMGNLNQRLIYGDGVGFPFYSVWFLLIDSPAGEYVAFALGHRVPAVWLIRPLTGRCPLRW